MPLPQPPHPPTPPSPQYDGMMASAASKVAPGRGQVRVECPLCRKQVLSTEKVFVS